VTHGHEAALEVVAAAELAVALATEHRPKNATAEAEAVAAALWRQDPRGQPVERRTRRAERDKDQTISAPLEIFRQPSCATSQFAGTRKPVPRYPSCPRSSPQYLN